MDRMGRIELLVKVAETGSFAKAAQALQMDPSAVSKSIGKLEKEMRVALFYRTTRQLLLTDIGEEIVRRGAEVVHDFNSLHDIAMDPPGTLTGVLKVGMSVPIGREIVMPRLPRFMAMHPKLRLESIMLTQFKEMQTYGADILLRAGGPIVESFVARELGTLKLGVYGSPKYLKEYGEPRTPKDLLSHRCIVYKPHYLIKPWSDWNFERRGVTQNISVPITMATDERQGMIAAVVAGGGLMRTGMFDPHLITSGQLKRVLTGWSCPDGPTWSAFYRRSVKTPSKITAFLQFLIEAAADFDRDELTVSRRPLTTTLPRSKYGFDI